MNIMKKKPELFKKTGKSSITLRNFLNNLKENDLHYENKQITQCVFLGVLRLKPVPSVFSNNVPSVNAIPTEKKTKKSKIINKELTKSVPQNVNINKVLSGKVSKKNSEKVKEALKKVPIKKPAIKIKLNTKKKVSKEKSYSSTKDMKKTLLAEMPKTTSPDSLIARTTITLNPIVSPIKFNPVQNLFDKLKQKIDESHNEPGPSGISKPTKSNLKLAGDNYNVCKINANVQSNINVSNCKKLKKVLQRKSPLPMTSSSSPITISDTESTGKKDKDDIILVENNLGDSLTTSLNKTTDDVIVISDDPNEKAGFRNRPRLLNRSISKHWLPGNEKSISNSPKLKQVTTTFIPINVYKEKYGTRNFQDIIVISDEPKQNEVPVEEHGMTKRENVINIEEVNELRVSPRFKKTEDTVNKDNELTDDINNTPSNRKSEFVLKTQQLTITIDSQNKESKRDPGKTSPKLLKLLETDEKNSVIIKQELIAAETTEKSKKRKNSNISSTLLPPMLLNAPMLLRSDLSAKKPNYAVDKPRFKKTREKPKANKKTLISTPTISEKREKDDDLLYSQPAINNKTKLSEEVICLSDTFKNQNTNISISIQNPSEQKSPEVLNDKHSTIEKTLPPHNACKKSPKSGNKKLGSDISNDSTPKTNTSNIIKNPSKVSPEINIISDDDVIIIKEEVVTKVPPRLLRSDLSKRKTQQNTASTITNTNSQFIDTNITVEVEETVDLSKEPEINNVSPRTLRSSQQKSPSTETNTNNDILTQKPKLSAKSTKEIPQEKSTLKPTESSKIDLDQIVVSEKNMKKQKVISPEKLKTCELVEVNDEKIEEVIVLIHDEPKGNKDVKDTNIQDTIDISEDSQPSENSSPRSLRSSTNKNLNSPQTSPVILTIGKGPKKSPKQYIDTGSNRVLRSDINSQTSSNSTKFSPKSTEKKKKLIKISQPRVDDVTTIVPDTEIIQEEIPISKSTPKQQHQTETSTKLSNPRKTANKLMGKRASKKVIVSKKKRRFINKNANTKQNTSMLLRSELAKQNTATSTGTLDEKRTKKQRTKSKNNDTMVSDNSINEQSRNTITLLSDKQKNKSPKTKAVIIQNVDINKPVKVENISEGIVVHNIKEESNNEDLQIIEPEKKIPKKRGRKPKYKILKNCVNANITERDVPQVEVNKNNNSEVLEVSKAVEDSNKTNVSVTEVSTELKKIAPTKRKSGSNKRSPRKRKLDDTKSEEENKTPEKEVEIRFALEVPQNTSKIVDTTVFDFEESELEVPPLRLSNTPKKDRESGETPVTPKTKKQKTNKVPVTKAKAKASLLPKIEENSNVENDSIDNEKNVKEKLSPKKKANQEDEKQKKDKRKSTAKGKTSAQPSNVSTETRRSISPLKQTTITDMFSRVMLKKEKSVPETVEGSESPEQQKENNSKDMPSPATIDRKSIPHSSDEFEDEEDPYEDDSDCESRMEWIPEEYAEYKFKYSAKKMNTYKPIHKCKICLLILPTYYKLSKHREEHVKQENPYNCKQCDEAFPSIDDLTAHLRIHKGKHPYTCKKCYVGFWSKKELDNHTPIHVLRKVKQPNKRFRCDVCAKEFSKLCDMERHTRVHTGEKPCVCNICNKRFQQSHNLSKHLLTHLHVKPFHCEICNKQFGRNDVLNRHLLTHSVEKPLKCPLCPKGFIRQTQLNNHMKKNHPNAAQIPTMNSVTNADQSKLILKVH